MLLGEIVAVALEALRANKLRSLLTMLGIIIGVGAVITMIALGSGAQKSVQDRIQALGPTLLSVYPGQSFMRGVASNNRVSLTLDDDTIAVVSCTRYNAAGYDVRLEVLGSAGSICAGLDDRMPVRSAEPGVSFPAGPAHR